MANGWAIGPDGRRHEAVQVVGAEPQDPFERWWRDEGAKSVGLESAKSFAQRAWITGRNDLVREMQEASNEQP